jgi:hypothetical protein
MEKVVKFFGSLEYIIVVWYILWPYGNLVVYFPPILVYYVKKNLATLISRCILQSGKVYIFKSRVIFRSTMTFLFRIFIMFRVKAFQSVYSGLNVLITIFVDFRQFWAGKNCFDPFLCQHSSNLSQNRQFYSRIFWAKIFQKL